MVTVLLIVSVFLLLGAGWMVVRVLRTEEHSKVELERIFVALQDMERECARRVKLIDTHAVEYFQSMNGEANRALTLVRQIQAGLKNLSDEVEYSLRAADLDAMLEHEKKLSGPFVLSGDATNMVSGSAFSTLTPMTLVEWDAKIDSLFNCIGESICEASDKKYELGLKRRTRRVTIEDLVSAGVRAVAERSRKISSGFKRPHT